MYQLKEIPFYDSFDRKTQKIQQNKFGNGKQNFTSHFLLILLISSYLTRMFIFSNFLSICRLSTSLAKTKALIIFRRMNCLHQHVDCQPF